MSCCDDTTKRLRRMSGCGILDIDSSVAKTWFRMETSARTGAQQLTPTSCVRMDIVRKGKEDVVASYPAFSVDNEGNISFYWDDALFSQPYGYYIGDIFISEQYCFSITLRIRKCEAVITACANEIADCEPSCEDDCPVAPCIPNEVDEAVPESVECAPTCEDMEIA